MSETVDRIEMTGREYHELQTMAVRILNLAEVGSKSQDESILQFAEILIGLSVPLCDFIRDDWPRSRELMPVPKGSWDYEFEKRGGVPDKD